MKKLWIGVVILAILSPIGLLLPEMLSGGDAWGEWGAEELEKMAGYLPEAFTKREPWTAPVPDYAFKGQEQSGLAALSVSYILSAVIGIAAVVGLAWGLGRLLSKREDADAA